MVAVFQNKSKNKKFKSKFSAQDAVKQMEAELFEEDKKEVKKKQEFLGNFFDFTGKMNQQRNIRFAKLIKDKKIQESKYILRVNSQAKLRWDIVVMIIAIYNTFTISLDIAYEPEQFKSNGFRAFNYLTDIVFFVDMGLNFRTAFYDFEGNEVVDPKAIALRNFKSVFFIDLLATLPLEEILMAVFDQENRFYKLFSLLKIGRLLKLEKIISYLNVEEHVKQFINLCKMILFLVIYIHCFACMWWYMATLEPVWVIPKFQVTDDFYQMYHFDSVSSRYLTSIYMSVNLIGGNDQSPRTSAQTFFLSIGLLIALFLNGMIFGELRVIINKLNK